MPQRITFPMLPRVEEALYMDKLNRLLYFIDEQRPSAREVREFMQEQDIWDREVVNEDFWEFYGVIKEKRFKLGKLGSKLLDARLDGKAEREILFRHVLAENEILAKYVFDALAERLHSDAELYRYLTSYVYPGKKLRRPDFLSYLKLLSVLGYIRVIGIRWALGDAGKEIMKQIEQIDVESLLEEEREEEGADEEEDDDDEKELAAAIARASKRSRAQDAEDEDAAAGAAAQDDDADRPSRGRASRSAEDEDEEGGGRREEEAEQERRARDDADDAEHEGHEGRREAPDERAAPPRPAGAQPAAHRAASRDDDEEEPPPRRPRPEPASEEDEEERRSVTTPGREARQEPVRRAPLPPRAAPAPAVDEELAEPAAASPGPAPLEPRPARRLPPQAATRPFGPSQVAENVERLRAWWAEFEPRQLRRATDFGMSPLEYELQPQAFLLKLCSLATLVVGDPRPADRWGFVNKLERVRFFPRLMADGAELYPLLAELQLFAGEPGHRMLAENLLTLLRHREQLAAQPELPARLASVREGGELIRMLSETFFAGQPGLEAHWVVREMVLLGVWKEPALRGVAAVPQRPARQMAYRLGLLDTPFAATARDVLDAARRITAVLGPETAFDEPLHHLAGELGCRPACPAAESCGYHCRECYDLS